MRWWAVVAVGVRNARRREAKAVSLHTYIMVSIIAAACANTRTMLSVYLRMAEIASPLSALFSTSSQTVDV